MAHTHLVEQLLQEEGGGGGGGVSAEEGEAESDVLQQALSHLVAELPQPDGGVVSRRHAQVLGWVCGHAPDSAP